MTEKDDTQRLDVLQTLAGIGRQVAASRNVLIVAATIPDGQQLAAQLELRGRPLLFITPRSPYGAHGCQAAALLVTPAASELPSVVLERLLAHALPAMTGQAAAQLQQPVAADWQPWRDGDHIAGPRIRCTAVHPITGLAECVTRAGHDGPHKFLDGPRG